MAQPPSSTPENYNAIEKMWVTLSFEDLPHAARPDFFHQDVVALDE